MKLPRATRPNLLGFNVSYLVRTCGTLLPSCSGVFDNVNVTAYAIVSAAASDAGSNPVQLNGALTVGHN